MKKKRTMGHIVFILSSIFLFTVGQTFADEIILENGNTLSETILKMEGGKLTLKTDYSQPIEIQTGKIKKIITKNPVEVYLVNGEVLKGKIKTIEEGKFVVEKSPGQEEPSLDWSRVASINLPPEISPQWKGSVNIGGSLQNGNTDSKALSAGAEVIRKTDRNRFTARFLFNYAEDKDDITARNTFGMLKYDQFFTKKLYGYLSLELYNDKFKDLDLRTVVGPGVGYQFWDDPVKSLLVEAGLAYLNEKYEVAQDKDWVTARLSADLRYKIKEYLVLSDQFVIYPSLEYGGQYILRNEAGILSPLGAGWGLKLANIIERNSDPPPGILRDDIYWILSLQYSF